MKLNDSKCCVIPLGSLLNLQKPSIYSFRWLTDAEDMEKLLGVPVGIMFQDDVIWKDLLLKLTDSIKHWASQKLSVFGRVHAARSYTGGKAWFLTTMVPPNQKGSKRLSALLWAYVQNNNILDPLIESNVHYSAWSRTTLVQPISAGGLNAQNYELQLKAIHARWIFKLLDPRQIASWKSLPFHFLRNVVPGLDDSIFLVDPSICSNITSLPTRWLAYLHAWFSSGVKVAPPPSDYECILNEPIWFNRFLHFEHDTKHGRLLKKETEELLIKRGYTHLSDFIAFSPPAGAGASPWLTKEDAILQTGSRSLGAAIFFYY
jgi:hypothetical protein